MFGDEMVNRHRAMKQAARPGVHPQPRRRSSIRRSASERDDERSQLRRLHRLRPVHPRVSGVRGDGVRPAHRSRAQQGASGGPRRRGHGRADLGLHPLRLLRRDLPERRPQREDRAAPPARELAGRRQSAIDAPPRHRAARSVLAARSASAPPTSSPRSKSSCGGSAVPPGRRTRAAAARSRWRRAARCRHARQAGVVADPVCLEQYDAEFLGVLAMQHLDLFELKPPFYYYAPHRIVNRDHARAYPLYDALRRRSGCDMNVDLNRLARSTSARLGSGAVRPRRPRHPGGGRAPSGRTRERSGSSPARPPTTWRSRTYSGRETLFITECLR